MKSFIKRSINRVNLKKEYISNFFSVFLTEKMLILYLFLFLKSEFLNFFSAWNFEYE